MVFYVDSRNVYQKLNLFLQTRVIKRNELLLKSIIKVGIIET